MITIPAMVLFFAILTIVTIRFRLVARVAVWCAYLFLTGFPLTLNFSAWYAGIGLIGPLAVLVLGGFAFHTSLGGQKVFEGKLLED